MKPPKTLCRAWVVVNERGKIYHYGDLVQDQLAVFRTRPKYTSTRADEFVVAVTIHPRKEKEKK